MNYRKNIAFLHIITLLFLQDDTNREVDLALLRLTAAAQYQRTNSHFIADDCRNIAVLRRLDLSLNRRLRKSFRMKDIICVTTLRSHKLGKLL